MVTSHIGLETSMPSFYIAEGYLESVHYLYTFTVASTALIVLGNSYSHCKYMFHIFMVKVSCRRLPIYWSLNWRKKQLLKFLEAKIQLIFLKKRQLYLTEQMREPVLVLSSSESPWRVDSCCYCFFIDHWLFMIYTQILVLIYGGDFFTGG